MILRLKKGTSDFLESVYMVTVQCVTHILTNFHFFCNHFLNPLCLSHILFLCWLLLKILIYAVKNSFKNRYSVLLSLSLSLHYCNTKVFIPIDYLSLGCTFTYIWWVSQCFERNYVQFWCDCKRYGLPRCHSRSSGNISFQCHRIPNNGYMNSWLTDWLYDCLTE